MVRVSEKFLQQITLLAKEGASIVSAFAARITNVADPIDPQDAATKYYVDSRGLTVKDESIVVDGYTTTLNFIGPGVQAIPGPPGTVNIQVIAVSPETFLSHWNAADGSNGSQAVTESITRTLTRISTPNGGEGTPFKTGGWAGSNHDTTLSSTVTFTTPDDTTGFGGDSTVTVTVYDGDGTVLQAFTTPSITADNVFGSPISGPIAAGRISVTITNYGADSSKFKARISAQVNIGGMLTDLGREGGRYHVVVTHTADSVTDGTGSYTYTQSDVFYDTNNTTPSISGTVTIAENAVVTKHISGIEYYNTGSTFTANVNTIDQHNRNTSRVSDSLLVNGSEYGLAGLSVSPFGTGAANFSGWTNNNNQNGVNYQETSWAVSAANFRYIGPTANVSGQVRDAWGASALVNSGNASILVDTYGTTSTNTLENFDDESFRLQSDYVTPWVSTNALSAGDALVFGSKIMAPNQSTYIRTDGANSANANWTTFKPNAGGPNPDYSALGVPVQYFRKFIDSPTADRASFQMVFSGTFAAGNALADLVGGNLEIYVRRISNTGLGGGFGPGSNPLRVHLPYPGGAFDDGVTIPGSGIREGSSAGNTINCTFGGLPCRDGIFVEVKILNANTQIDAIAVTFY